MDEINHELDKLLKDECEPIIAPTLFDRHSQVLLFHSDYFLARREKRRKSYLRRLEIQHEEEL